MKTKILGLEPAFELASILSKYADTTNPDKDAIEFISEILEKISPQEYLACVKLLTDIEEKDLDKTDSLDFLAAFMEGLRSNSIVSLIGFYRSLGF